MNHATPAREHKDRLFKALFGDEKNKRNTLELYNAVNNSCYTNEDDITLTMIDDAIYLGMKNDVSFLIADTMQLYEHQSTVNPNMPLRGFPSIPASLTSMFGIRCRHSTDAHPVQSCISESCTLSF